MFEQDPTLRHSAIHHHAASWKHRSTAVESLVRKWRLQDGNVTTCIWREARFSEINQSVVEPAS